MKLTQLSSAIAASLLLAACGGSDDTAPTTARVSFSIADAPVDSADNVVVTYRSITLKRSAADDDDSDNNIEIPLVDEAGEPVDTLQIDLLDYQNGDSLLVINNVELPVGDYQELIINTEGCPQNQNGSSDDCYVVNGDGTFPLVTPSNKLRLGGFTVGTEGVQAYTIDFNLRKSLVERSNGMAFNLKPHGVTIVDNSTVGSISGSIDPNLFSAGECIADSGNVVYLYQGAAVEGQILADEFDPEFEDNAPEGAIEPYASKQVALDEESGDYRYQFAFLPQGDYQLAFSCSAENDDPELYDGITIADPEGQVIPYSLSEGENASVDFEETVEVEPF